MTLSLIRSSADAVDCLLDLGRADQLTPERLRHIVNLLSANLDELWMWAAEAPACPLNQKAKLVIEKAGLLLDSLVQSFGQPTFTATEFEAYMDALAAIVIGLRAWTDDGQATLSPAEVASAVAYVPAQKLSRVQLTVIQGGLA